MQTQKSLKLQRRPYPQALRKHHPKNLLELMLGGANLTSLRTKLRKLQQSLETAKKKFKELDKEDVRRLDEHYELKQKSMKLEKDGQLSNKATCDKLACAVARCFLLTTSTSRENKKL